METRDKNAVLKFYREQKAKGYKINMARNCIIGIMAFYTQNCEQIKGITRELDPVQIPDNEFVFNQETLRRLYYYGNLNEKTMAKLRCLAGICKRRFIGYIVFFSPFKISEFGKEERM